MKLTVGSDERTAVTDAIIAQGRSAQRLLILDNCEHVLDAVAAIVVGLLAACPAVQILATSRAPLHVRGEQELSVDPLPLPPLDDASVAAITENEAVRLFAVRARAVRPGPWTPSCRHATFIGRARGGRSPSVVSRV